ncbi:hypothetical protein CHL67_05110 [Prosthecochloris sp. GSB1]|nr:hypothetical protein CHL67_05110 [Prosthecochloris sp. GSB1]
MQNTLVQFTGTGWFRAPFRNIRDRLVQAFLHRFVSFVRNYTFGPPSGLPMHLLMIGSDTRVSFCDRNSPLPFQAGGMSLPGLDFCACSGGSRCFACHDSAFDGNTLTSFPLWRSN